MSGKWTYLLTATVLTMSCAWPYPAEAEPNEAALQRIIKAQERHSGRLMAVEGVVGTAAASEGIMVIVERPDVADKIPKSLDGVPVVVKVAGKIRALETIDPTARSERPAPIGVSTGKEGEKIDEESVKIGNERQLFVDDYLIEKMNRVTRTYHEVEKYPGNPVLVSDKPWEALGVYIDRKKKESPDIELEMAQDGDRTYVPGYDGWALLYGTVLFDEEEQLFKMWYLTLADFDSGNEFVQCYATSKDGVHWDKPNLGLFEYKGSKANNIVIRQSVFENFDECFCVIKDLHDPDAQRRYKAIFYCHRHGDYDRALWSATSPDGIRWKISKAPILTPTGDATSFFYDHLKNRYVAVPRPIKDQSAKALSFSDDFKTWTPMQTVLRPLPEKEHKGEYREQIYNFFPFTYESMYVGINQVYYWHPHWALVGEWVFSRDGLNWARPEPWRPHFPVGGPGEFDRTNNSFSSGPPTRVGDKLYFYYSGRSYRHREYHRYEHGKNQKDSGEWEGSIGLAMLRVDGFASIDAPYGPDRYLITKPLLFEGDTLRLNAKCDRGRIRVELQDETGAPIEGFTAGDCDLLRANSVDIIVTWKNNPNIGKRAGKPTRLRFVMENTRLYSFWID